MFAHTQTAGFVAGFLGAEGVLKVDSASVNDRHKQDQRIDGFIADVGCPAIRILELPLKFADGPVEFIDLFTEFEALRGQILLVQPVLGFHLGDVVLDSVQGGTP